METSVKRNILSLLKTKPLETVLSEARAFPPRQAVSALIPALCHTDSTVKWHAVSALGVTTHMLAEEDIEAARAIVRRLMWSLNDESGGIGWGAPEALGEILAVHPRLAEEYAFALVAYMREDGLYLKHPLLQRGLLWGIGRLAAVQPDLLRTLDAPSHLIPYLDSEDPEVRGLAARAIGILQISKARDKVASLENAPDEFLLYTEHGLTKTTVGTVVQEALHSFSLDEVI